MANHEQVAMAAMAFRSRGLVDDYMLLFLAVLFAGAEPQPASLLREA